MSEYEVEAPCECGGLLGARLDADRRILHGWARRPLEVDRERAPALSIGNPSERFDIAWWCPLCGRKTLRMIHAGALRAVPTTPGSDGAAAA